MAATFVSATYVVTASAGTGGSISPTGAIAVAAGTSKTFTVTPSSGYSVSSVGGTCGGILSGNTYTTKAITANCTVTVAFAQQSYVVTASAGTGGNINPSGYITVSKGSTRQFTVTPSAGYKVSSVGGTCGGALNGNSYTINAINGNCTVTAAFVQAPATTYTVTASAGTGGSINPAGAIAVAAGTTKTFTVTPNFGYRISSVGGTCVGMLSSNNYMIQGVNGNCTVTVSFAPLSSITTYLVTSIPNISTLGTISPSSILVPSGSTAKFTVTPNAGYYIAGVGGSVGGGTQGTRNGSSFTTGIILSNCTVVATFLHNPTVTASASAGGNISPSGAVSVNGGATRIFTVTPNMGYKISSVGGTCGGVLNGNTYTTNALTVNCTVTASFIPAS